MNKNLSKILTFLFIFLALICLMCLIFHKDYGFDIQEKKNTAPLKGIDNVLPEMKNVTINSVDFLQSQLPLGKFGGTFTTSIMGEPKTFNPYNANDATSAELSELMYDGLTYTDPSSGKVMPKLAKSIEILPDKKTYIVRLRHGLKWSDNTEITAKDVYFTYNTVIFKGFGDGSALDVMRIDGEIPKIELIDKYTVKFITPKPFAPFLRTLSASIVPEHVFKKATDKGNEYFLTYQGIDIKPNELVISGAFKLSEYVPSERVVFVRNPNYYIINTKNERLPYIDKWVSIITGDTNNDTLKFESGITDVLSVNGALVDRYRELQKYGEFELYNLGSSTNTTFISFNLNNRKNKQGKYYVDPIKQSWFQDKNFRSALDWAIDRDDLILNIFHGKALPLYSAESIRSLFINEKVAKGHKKDINYAKELLMKSGFYLKDNILYDKKGNKVEFELLTNAGNTQREASGVSIKEDLEALGMKVNFKPVEFNSLVNRIVNQADFDCVIMALTSNISEPNSGYNVWSPYSSLHLFNKRTQNDLQTSDKLLDFEIELEKLFKQGALELDYNKRKAIYDKYQEIVAEENPFIYLYAPLNITAVRSRVKNVFPSKFGGLYTSLAEIYIDN
ncbi:MAG: ABC transporter substrate-binding protein [Candidatus Gastranaerophilales bacterium]|nr:ABC transporter substrate-binding protein [Candidatus Gastranaerophilales bacterium]